jgi:hypothetical protein
LPVIQVAVSKVQLGGSMTATRVTLNGNFNGPEKLGMGGSFAN